MLARRARDQRGAAVVDVVLVMVVLVPLVLGIVQVGLVLHVRNTLASAAAEGARAAATLDASNASGIAAARSQLERAIDPDLLGEVSVRRVVIGGRPTVEVVVTAEVPPLGLAGPGVPLRVEGHAVQELP